MTESSTNQPQFNNEVKYKNPTGRNLFSPIGERPREKMSEHPPKDDDMLIDGFDLESESFIGINYNMVYVLTLEYDQVTKVKEIEDIDKANMAKHMPVCYYVMNNGCA